MKIVHICLVMGYTEGLNYQENYIIRYQAKAGHEVSLITTDHCFNEGEWGLCRTENDYINPDGVHIIRLPFAFKLPYSINRQIGIFKGFKDKLEELSPDLIFVHNLQFQDLRRVEAYKKAHQRVIIYADSHSDFSNSARNWFSRNTLYRFWWRPCAKSAEPFVRTFFGVTPGRVDFLKDILGISEDKTDLLVMGADDESVERAEKVWIRQNVREKFSIAENDFLVVTGGKIDVFKTQTLLLMKAVQEIKNDNLKLLVFGSVEEELKDKMLSLCDGKKIQYIGWATGEQPYEYFASADLVVFPGRHSVYWEQVVAQGIPMFCKYWEGTTHVDIGGNVEFLMEDSIKLIKEKLIELLEAPEKYRKMKACASSDKRHQFSYKMIARRAAGVVEGKRHVDSSI